MLHNVNKIFLWACYGQVPVRGFKEIKREIKPSLKYTQCIKWNIINIIFNLYIFYTLEIEINC